MGSVNTGAAHKFVIVLNEKSPTGKLFSATGQIAMSLYHDASDEQRKNMSFIPFINPENKTLISVSTCSFVVLKGSGNQLLNLFSSAKNQNILCALFTSTMSYNGIEEDLVIKTASTALDQAEIYGAGLFGSIDTISALTKKFSVFK